MDYYEKTEKEIAIFSGKIINLKKIEVSLPNGKKTYREIIEHPGAVAVLAINNENEIILIKQFRKALNKIIWEIPAGKLEKGEKPLNSAKRELKEETGYTANSWISLGSFYTTPGFTNEIIHLFLAQNLQKGETNFDADEYVEVHSLNFAEINKMLANQEIDDGKTLIALLKYQLRER